MQLKQKSLSEAEARLERAIEILDNDTTEQDHRDDLGRVDEARPIVDKLLAQGWADADFRALCEKYGPGSEE